MIALKKSKGECATGPEVTSVNGKGKLTGGCALNDAVRGRGNHGRSDWQQGKGKLATGGRRHRFTGIGDGNGISKRRCRTSGIHGPEIGLQQSETGAAGGRIGGRGGGNREDHFDLPGGGSEGFGAAILIGQSDDGGGGNIGSVEINVPESATLRSDGWRNAVEGDRPALDEGDGSGCEAGVVALGKGHDGDVGRRGAGSGGSGGRGNRRWGGVDRAVQTAGADGAAGRTAGGQIGYGDGGSGGRLGN